MKKKILSLLLVLSFSMSQAQLDKNLDKFKFQIVKALKENGEIANKTKADSLQFKYLYSRRLATVNSKIIYYELGRMTDHGYKFLAVYNNGLLTVFPTIDFNADFIKIIAPLENVKVKKTNIFELFTAIKNIYDYNTNPPWDRLK